MRQTSAFVVPHWTDDIDRTSKILERTVDGIVNQTDDDWLIVIVDDQSSDSRARPYLSDLQGRFPGRIDLGFHDANLGPGGARNTAIQHASRLGCRIVLFNDADDVSSKHRLAKTRRAFAEDAGVGVVYGGFEPVDEMDRPIAAENLTPSLREILCALAVTPPQGEDAWLEMGTSTGYANLTSATAVHIDLAKRCPFPLERVSEDFHTFLRYSAYGGTFVYLKGIATQYRVPISAANGSSSRDREGDFYVKKAKTDTSGFVEALRYRLSQGDKLDPQNILMRFNIRIAITLLREGELMLGRRYLEKAERYQRIAENSADWRRLEELLPPKRVATSHGCGRFAVTGSG